MNTKARLALLVVGAALLLPSLASAQANPPHIMVLVDTSGSMLGTIAGDFVGGDGSNSPSPQGTCCPGFDISGDGIADGYQSRGYIAKDVLREAVESVGEEDVVFGLASYYMVETTPWSYCSGVFPGYCDISDAEGANPCNTWWDDYCPDIRAGVGVVRETLPMTYHGDTCPSAATDSGTIHVSYADASPHASLLQWIDNDEEWPGYAGGTTTNRELRFDGFTPLAGATVSLRNYFRDVINPMADPPCESFAVILTDGGQSPECNHNGTPEAAATLLAAQGVTVYVIAFALDSSLLGTMDAMAANGGTFFARVANSRDDLRAAFAEIIEDAIRVESCNDADDDCDGEVDEGLFRPCSTICGAGQETCDWALYGATSGWGGCDAPAPVAETCDNVDNDCDGSVDESLTQGCSTACGSGTETCQRGVWVGCTAPVVPPEVCDGVDNDCDGSTDEDDPLLGDPCGTDTGACTTGTWLCVGGDLTCSGINPTAEACDLARADEDCDGQVNEGLTRACSVANGFGTCTGLETCNSGAGSLWINCTAPTPAAEICDNADNDCDGSVDEGLTQACSTECDPDGVRTCTAGTWGACSRVPTVEDCDNFDDDCDGAIDDNVWRTCTVFGCSGWQQCVAGVYGACDVGDVVELCNNADDDCDGLVDDGLSRACVTACGTGTETCAAGAWGACSAPAPAPETCDNLDNDCDGTRDEGLARACGTAFCPGEEHCAAGVWIGCTAPASAPETCDNRDNDCDGTVDDGITPRACSTACGTGTETCVAGVYRDCTARAPAPESCNNADDDCDGAIDEGVTRGCAVGSCSGIETCAAGAWGDCAIVIHDEVCNNLDDDCDTAVDEDLLRVCSTVCGAGSQSCAAGAWSACTAPTPSPEDCDNLDNDCDGLVDDELTRGCSTICGEGLESCTAGFWGPCSAPQPTDEVCDGLDNDCDGDLDEDDPDVGEPCGTDEGVCELGEYVCDGGVLDCLDDVEPSDELCDLLDNDCDGMVDEGLPLGQACCSDDDGCMGQLGDDLVECDCEDFSFEPTSACVPGHFVCEDGALVCEGYGGPAVETCDCIDNDCDGFIDENLPVGEQCGEDRGECEFGNEQCVECAMICVGGTPAQDEICDLLDNDCDGLIDEDFEFLCPDEDAVCMEGQCALPCGDTEFPCPPGKHCVDGYCLGDPCEGVVCHGECERCNSNTGLCQDMCEGTTCPEGTRCDCGRCWADDCYHFGCEEGFECVRGECVDDPCAGVSCDEDEFCRGGECIAVCGPEVVCPDGQRCYDGECVDWPCAGVSCPGGEQCNPETGECTDACRGVNCGEGQVCDPASGACEDDPCLAMTGNCPEGTHCEDGTCVFDPVDPDAGPDGGHHSMWVLGTGGGGCPCSAAAPRPAGRASLLLALAFLGVVWWRRRSSR
jgi:hypothetical protein